jgi:hypothetical protein
LQGCTLFGPVQVPAGFFNGIRRRDQLDVGHLPQLAEASMRR